MFKQLQQVGKAFMLPIAILPAAGLLLGIGAHYLIKLPCKLSIIGSFGFARCVSDHVCSRFGGVR